MTNCLRCAEKFDRIRPGQQYGAWEDPMCEDCRTDAEEAAYERHCEDYYGGSGPVTIQEQYDAAVKERRELRRLD